MGRHFDKKMPVDTLVLVGTHNTEWIKLVEEAGWQCFCCTELNEAQDVFTDIGPCVGVLDLTNEQFNINDVATLAHKNKQVRWIAVVSSELMDSDVICQLISNFCVDYFTVPVPNLQLINTIGHQKGMLQLEQRIWPELIEYPDFGLIGDSPQMGKLRAEITRIAQANFPVLIKGESGTGKELIAKAIYLNNEEKQGPMMSLNCSLINDENEQYRTIFDEEEFYTGRLSKVNNGTLFLNEVGELPPAYQTKLMDYFLRNNPDYLQKTGRPKLNIRIIASTHIDLEKAVDEEKFREDLFYRLNILPVLVPSLRDRGQDVVQLAEYFLMKFANEYNTHVRTFSDEAKSVLTAYNWPGNVRELINQVKRAVLLADSIMVEVKHLDLPNAVDMKQSLRRVREDSEKDALMTMLESCNGKVTVAAKELGVSRATMYRLLNKHNLIASGRKYKKDNE